MSSHFLDLLFILFISFLLKQITSQFLFRWYFIVMSSQFFRLFIHIFYFIEFSLFRTILHFHMRNWFISFSTMVIRHMLEFFWIFIEKIFLAQFSFSFLFIFYNSSRIPHLKKKSPFFLVLSRSYIVVEFLVILKNSSG